MEASVARVPEVKVKVDNMSPQQLEARRREIVDSAKGDYQNLSTELLQELSYISSSLRRRSAGPPRAKSTPKAKPTLDDLL